MEKLNATEPVSINQSASSHHQSSTAGNKFSSNTTANANNNNNNRYKPCGNKLNNSKQNRQAKRGFGNANNLAIGETNEPDAAAAGLTQSNAASSSISSSSGSDKTLVGNVGGNSSKKQVKFNKAKSFNTTTNNKSNKVRLLNIKVLKWHQKRVFI